MTERLSVGADGHVDTKDVPTPTGLRWEPHYWVIPDKATGGVRVFEGLGRSFTNASHARTWIDNQQHPAHSIHWMGTLPPDQEQP